MSRSLGFIFWTFDLSSSKGNGMLPIGEKGDSFAI
jgi:hypothetical protein